MCFGGTIRRFPMKEVLVRFIANIGAIYANLHLYLKSIRGHDSIAMLREVSRHYIINRGFLQHESEL